MTDAREPAENELLIRGGHVLTMDPEIGDLSVGDVHIIDGAIVAVTEHIDAPTAQQIDADGSVVLPGLIDTHWHMWSSLFRAQSDARGGTTGYFRTLNELGPEVTADDAALGVLLSCVEAIDAGYTTVHDWAQNVRGPEHAEAELRVLRESGLRARFSYGWSIGQANDATIDLADLTRLQRAWPPGIIGLGMAWRGPGGSDPSMRVPPEIYRAELEVAHRLGFPSPSTPAVRLRPPGRSPSWLMPGSSVRSSRSCTATRPPAQRSQRWPTRAAR